MECIVMIVSVRYPFLFHCIPAQYTCNIPPLHCTLNYPPLPQPPPPPPIHPPCTTIPYPPPCLATPYLRSGFWCVPQAPMPLIALFTSPHHPAWHASYIWVKKIPSSQNVVPCFSLFLKHERSEMLSSWPHTAMHRAHTCYKGAKIVECSWPGPLPNVSHLDWK